MKIDIKDCNLQYVFSNLKNGDALFFYHKQWWAVFSKLISLFTGGKVDHVGVCLEVKKTESSVIFNFSEQTFSHGGRYEPFAFFKQNNSFRISGFSANTIYYGKLKNVLKDDQLQLMIDDAKMQVGKSYGKGTLLKTLNWFDSVFSKKQTAKDVLRVCSTHAQVMYKIAGIISEDQFKKDDFYNPFELMKSGIFEIYKVQDYNG